MRKVRIFLASSSELEQDRREFEIFLCRQNATWVDKGIFLELVIWEDFLDALSKTRLQDEYNREIRTCDLFVMLYWTKVGQYTEEEFETAVGQFKATSKPFVFVYFKQAPQNGPAAARPSDSDSLQAFQQKLKDLGHFQTVYRNTEGLLHHFSRQLEKLAANGFIEFKPDQAEQTPGDGDNYRAHANKESAIAQGEGATAVAPQGVIVEGNNTGNITTGTQTYTDTGGGAYIGGNIQHVGGDFVGRDKIVHGPSAEDLAALFDALKTTVARDAPAERQAEGAQQVDQLQAEVAKGEQADDRKMANIIDGLAAMVPGAIGKVVSMFATPVLSGIAGPVTRYVLDKLKGN